MLDVYARRLARWRARHARDGDRSNGADDNDDNDPGEWTARVVGVAPAGPCAVLVLLSSADAAGVRVRVRVRVGDHIVVRDGAVQRPFTPYAPPPPAPQPAAVVAAEPLAEDWLAPPPGHLALLIRLYASGTMSARVRGWRPDHQLTCSGPTGAERLAYRRGRWSCVAMLCCGTGVLPMLQLMRAVCADAADETRLRLLYVHRGGDAVLAKPALDQLAAYWNVSIQYAITPPVVACSAANAGVSSGAGAATAWSATAMDAATAAAAVAAPPLLPPAVAPLRYGDRVHRGRPTRDLVTRVVAGADAVLLCGTTQFVANMRDWAESTVPPPAQLYVF